MQAMYCCWDKPRVHIDIFLPCRWKHKAHNRCEPIGPQKFFPRLLSDTGFTAAGQTEVIPPRRKRLKMECCGRAEKRLDAVRPTRVMRKAVFLSQSVFFPFLVLIGLFFFSSFFLWMDESWNISFLKHYLSVQAMLLVWAELKGAIVSCRLLLVNCRPADGLYMFAY